MGGALKIYLLYGRYVGVATGSGNLRPKQNGHFWLPAAVHVKFTKSHALDENEASCRRLSTRRDDLLQCEA